MLIFTRNVHIEALAFTVQVILPNLELSKRRPNSKGEGHRVTNVDTFEKVLTLESHVKYQSITSRCVRKLLAGLKF